MPYYSVLIHALDEVSPEEVKSRVQSAIETSYVGLIVSTARGAVTALGDNESDGLGAYATFVAPYLENHGDTQLDGLDLVDLLDYWEVPVGPVVRPDTTGRFSRGGKACIAPTHEDCHVSARFHVVLANGAYAARSYCTLDAYRSDLGRVNHPLGHYIVDEDRRR